MEKRAIKMTFECVVWLRNELYDASDEEAVAYVAADLEENIFDDVKVISYETHTE